jgi:hypothetical protein
VGIDVIGVVDAVYGRYQAPDVARFHDREDVFLPFRGEGGGAEAALDDDGDAGGALAARHPQFAMGKAPHDRLGRQDGDGRRGKAPEPRVFAEENLIDDHAHPGGFPVIFGARGYGSRRFAHQRVEWKGPRTDRGPAETS